MAGCGRPLNERRQLKSVIGTGAGDARTMARGSAAGRLGGVRLCRAAIRVSARVSRHVLKAGTIGSDGVAMVVGTMALL